MAGFFKEYKCVEEISLEESNVVAKVGSIWELVDIGKSGAINIRNTETQEWAVLSSEELEHNFVEFKEA